MEHLEAKPAQLLMNMMKAVYVLVGLFVELSTPIFSKV